MLTELSAFSCVLPAIIGSVKYKRMDAKFHPFVWIMYLSVITETSIYIIRQTQNYAHTYCAVANSYYIINVLLFLLFFKRLAIISKPVFICLSILSLANLLGFMYYFSPINSILLNATVLYDTILLALTVTLLSKQVFVFNIPFHLNTLFIIGGMFLFYTAFSVFLNIIYLLGLKTEFNSFLFNIHRYVNLVTYLVFAWALICVPVKVFSFSASTKYA